MSKLGTQSTATLPQAELEVLNELLDSPEVRVGARDGFECGPGLVDTSISLILVVADQSFNQNISGCVSLGPEGNAVQQIHDLITKY
jgi:hypothetical protein